MIDNPRLRLALAEHGRRIALALAVLGAALLVLAIWTALTPPTDTVTERTATEEFATEIDHGATVRARDAPWERGTELSNHPAYLLNASPTLEVGMETDAPPGATVDHTVRLRLRVVRDGAVVWEDVRLLVADRQTVEDGPVRSAAEIDVRDLRGRWAALQTEFAGVGTVRSEVVADASYESERYDGNLTATAPLSVTDRAYWLEGDPAASETRSQTRVVTRTAPIEWSTVLTLVLFGLGAVAGAAGAATYRVEADIEWLRQELHRQRYDDWISDGDLPMGVGSEYVSLDSLKDVVDVAIDTNQRVVYDDRRNVFAVISGEVVYYYSKDGDWNRVAWPGADESGDGPSFLEAFGMGDEPPEVEAGPSTGADVGPFGAGDEPMADGAPPGDGPPPAGGTGDATSAPGAGPAGGGAGEPDEGPFSSGDGGESPGSGDAEPPGDGDPPADGSLGPAERPPADRPFGGEDDEEEES